MRSSLKLLSGLAILTLACGLHGFAKSDKEADKNAPTSEKKDDKKKDGDKKKGDKKKKDDRKKDPKQKDDDKNAPKSDDPPKLNLPLVKDHDSFDIKIPYKDANGKLQMIYYIGVATKIDDDKIRMKDTKVETYNDEGEVEMTVNLPVSELDLNTRIITSQTKTTVTREDFTITGDGVRFDTNPERRVASLVGHVRMIVYDQKDEEATPPPAAPQADE